MKTFNRLLTLVFVMSVLSFRIGYAKQTDLNKEIGRLISSDPDERAAAATILGNIGDRSAVGPLISLLNDKDPKVREKAVTALNSVLDPRAVEPLIGALKDPDADVKREATRALRAITGESFGKNPTEWQAWWDKNKEPLQRGK